MTDQELNAIRAIIKEELDPIKEDLAEVRSGVNTLLDWADKVGDSISFPLPKIVP